MSDPYSPSEQAEPTTVLYHEPATSKQYKAVATPDGNRESVGVGPPRASVLRKVTIWKHALPCVVLSSPQPKSLLARVTRPQRIKSAAPRDCRP